MQDLHGPENFIRADVMDYKGRLTRKKKAVESCLYSYTSNDKLNIDCSRRFDDQLDELYEKREKLIEEGGIKSRIQTYDVRDSDRYHYETLNAA